MDLAELDGLVVKKIASTYSPGVLDRLEILAYLESLGVAVFSRPSSIARLVDRLACTRGLIQAGLPMPATVVTEDRAEAARAVTRFGKAVFKPLYSSKARGMILIQDGPEAAERIGAFGDEHGMMYIQELVDHPGQDLGVSFLGGEYVGTYARQGSGDSWDTTTRSGGKYVAVEPGNGIVDLARRAQAVFDMDFTCVDVVETPRGLMLYEVSAFGGFRGLQDALGLDAAGLYADFVLERA
jgi:ribosomal protein S6--L-glutamate ligase